MAELEPRNPGQLHSPLRASVSLSLLNEIRGSQLVNLEVASDVSPNSD